MLFVSCVFVTKAGTYYAGLNELNSLLTSVTDKDGNDLAGIPPYLVLNTDTGDSVTNNNVNDAQSAGWQYPGTVWADTCGSNIVYWNNGCNDGSGGDNYYMLTSIDWSNNGYIQKAGMPIVWQQGDIYGVIGAADADKNAVQDRDLQFLDNLNFSGNKFYDFELDGSGITPVTHINFSNNPTLQKLVIQNCPNIIDVDITNSGLRLSTVYSISQTVESDAKLLYNPQGIVSLTYPVDAVDLSADAALGGTATTITWEGSQPTANDNGVFTFDASLVGQTVKAVLTNSKLSDFGASGLEYDITLTASGTGIPAIQTDKATVYSDNGQLYITSTVNRTANIYLIDGSLVKILNLTAGTSNTALPSGVYIVRFNNGEVQKIVVK